MKLKSSFTSLLAILQQAEYDLQLWQNWIKVERKEEFLAHLAALQPERWTTKLKLIARLGHVYGLVLPPRTAIQWAVLTLKPLETIITKSLVWLAAQKLRRRQNQGLVVVGIAGSYGKTSVKHLTHHVLSHKWFTLMTPASYNTPLGLALTILKQLTPQHALFLAELGEYEVDDIAQFLQWLRPQYAILTPVGYAHSQRFGSVQALQSTFQPLFTHQHAPTKVFVADENRQWLKTPASAVWYGQDSDSQYQCQQIQASLTGSEGQLHSPGDQSVRVSTRLLGQHQLLNALPALALTQELGSKLDTSIKALRYAPDIPRRLSLTKNLNGTYLIDNSYNTNPGSWQEMYQFLRAAQLPQLAVITGGFVEIDPPTRTEAHHQLAHDLAEVASVVGVIRSHTNEDLITALKQAKVPLVTGFTQAEVVEQLTQQSQPITHLWIEGGMRELYQ